MADVYIKFENRRVYVSPDPVIISLGESIKWIFNASSITLEQDAGYGQKSLYRVSILQMLIYFGYNLPFSSVQYLANFSLDQSRNSFSGQISSGPALETGDFKYGIRLIDPNRNTTLEDEDPHIIVR